MTKRINYAVWIGRGLSALLGALFLMSAYMKFKGGSQVEEGLAHLGMPMSLLVPIGIVELACAAIYLVPATAMLGSILLTGYLGGVIFAHLRVGDPIIMPVVLGVLVWLAIALRDDRLWKLIPVRRSSARAVEEPAAVV